MDIYVITWSTQDLDDRFEVHAFGKTLDGQSVVCRVTCKPYLYVKLGGSLAKRRLFLHDAATNVRSIEHLSRLVSYKDAWGYNPEPHHFAKLVFLTLRDQKRAKKELTLQKYEVYEGNVDPIIRLCHDRGISPVGWIHVDPRMGKPMYNADLEYAVHAGDIGPSEETRVPPLVICSWDIEVYSHDGSFPKASHPDNTIIQIASAFQRLGEPEPYETVVICLDETASVDGMCVDWKESETEVLVSWIRLLKKHSVDMFLAYNSWQFDWEYILGRQVVFEELMDDSSVTQALKMLGRGGKDAGMARRWELNSGAYGQNSYSLIRAPGVLDIDLMQIIKRDHKLDSYSLNNVSATFLKESKIDLPAYQIFEKFVQGPEERAEIARYAAKDVLLPLRLFSKLNIFDNLSQMAIATCVPLEYLLTRGQQIKVFSLILRQAKEMGYVLPDDKAIGISGKFEGATVLDAKKGVYYDPVCGLDFASLYPSIMRSFNLCYSTLILPGTPEQPPDTVYTVDTGLGTYSFYQGEPGIVPTLLQNLATWRKNAKKKMAECKKRGDEFGVSLWNGAQLAFKISMNSVYGFTGASKGFLPCVPIAAATTATGRRLIDDTKRLCLEMVPGSDVVYGDSVASYTPIYIRISGKVQITTFEALAADLEWYVGMDGKEYHAPHDMETWSDIGWTRVERIIRHQHNADLIRVNTHTGLVDVTEHHSLLDHTGAMVKPADISIGHRLLHAPLPVFEDGSECHMMNTDIAQIYGFFCGDGSCGKYKTTWGLKYSFALNNADLELLKKYQSLCQSSFPDVIWVILDTINSSGVYKLIPRSTTHGSIRDIVLLFRKELYVDKSKVVPTRVLSSSVSIKEAFWKGLCDSDGIKSDSMRIDQKSQLSVATIIALFSELKYISSIHTRLDKKEIFRITGSKKQRKDGSAIKKIFPVPYSGYVYDFSTANHHFSAGPGNLVVHNTDSVMVRFKVPEEHTHDLTYHFKVAEDVAAKITDHFPGCVELEFEKVYYPYMLFSKKRYAGLMFTNPSAPDYIDVKGIQVVRRDNAPIVKKVSQEILDAIMYEKSTDVALQKARDSIGRVLRGQEPIESFVVSKTLRGSYANPNAQPHVLVARKIQERTGKVIQSGVRVPYVFVVDENVDKLISHRAEDPEFVVENKVPIDYVLYIDNQLTSPINALLELLVPNPMLQILSHEDIHPVLESLRQQRQNKIKETKRVRLNKANRQPEITNFFKK